MEEALKNANYIVEINTEKPRKGAFVVTTLSGEDKDTVIELLDMPRPFKKLKEYDLDEAIATYLASK